VEQGQKESAMPEVDANSLIFRPVPGGYVYRSPSQWIFGASQHYLVSEEQKAQLVATMKIRRPALLAFAILTAAVLTAVAAAAIVWLVSPHENPTLIDGGMIAFLVLGGLYLEFCGFVRYRMRLLRPILPTLTPTEQRITNRQVQAAMDKIVSVKQLLLLALLNTLASGCYLVAFIIWHQMGRSEAYMPLVLALLFGALGLIYYKRLFRKLGNR